MEEESIEILAENTKKNNFIRKISSQTEEHKQIVRKRSGDGLDLSCLGSLSVTGYKTFSLENGSRILKYSAPLKRMN